MLPKRFKRNLMYALLAPALAIPAAVLAQAQVQDSTPPLQQQQAKQSSQIDLQRGEIRMSELKGMDVKNAQGEDLGEVKDVVIDTRSGQVEYVALSHGGVLGMGEDLFAYPARAFETQGERGSLVLDVQKEELEDNEGFNDANWPQVRQDEAYWASIDERFADAGTDASTGASTGTVIDKEKEHRSFVRASDLVGADVKGPNGNDIGEVEDMIVNLDKGEARVALVDPEDGDKVVQVPMSELEVQGDGDDLNVRTDREKLGS